MTHALQAAHVRVPCSTSNLGAGFDLIGLALNRYLTARFEPGDGTLGVVRSGTLADLSQDEPDLLVTAFRDTVEADGVEASGTLYVDSEIPIGRGLGSSATAVIAGHELGLAALGHPSDPEAAFLAAFRAEGHGDNAAPSAFGGLQAVVNVADGPSVLELELSPEIGFAYAAPGTPSSTREARAALPAMVSHETAVGALGALASLMRGLAQGDPDLLRSAMDDALHVPYRLPLIPTGAAAISAGYDAGAWAVTISGAGSGLIAMASLDQVGDVADAMHAVFAMNGASPGMGFALTPDLDGVVRLSTPADD